MSWDDLIEYNRRWVELHKDNGHQTEAASRMTAMIDKMDELRSDEAVESAADGILASFAEVIEAQDRRLPPITDVQRRHAEKYARAAIDALLRDD